MNNKPFLTLGRTNGHWRIVLAREASPGTAILVRTMHGMTSKVRESVPYGEPYLTHLISRLTQQNRIPVDFSHIFGSYDEAELAEAFKAIEGQSKAGAAEVLLPLLFHHMTL